MYSSLSQASTVKSRFVPQTACVDSRCPVQATKRLEENGPNKLSPPKDKPEWLKYLLQYTNPLLFLLIIAGVLTFVAYAIQVRSALSVMGLHIC